MSFGASPSDIIIVVTFCKNLYRKCRDAGGEYDEISREVRGLHTVLRHLKYEVEDPDSTLNRDRSVWGRQVAHIVGDGDATLRQLDGLLQKYGRLGRDSSGSGSPSSPRVMWDRVRFGSNEMDQLGAIRVKLISHKTSLTLFLDTIQLREGKKMSTALNDHGGQLDVILDKVDSIAARMGQRPQSVMTTYDDDDKEVWKQFRRELVSEGFSSSVLKQNKEVLRAYIREIDQKGLLDDAALGSQINVSAKGVMPELWLESVATGSTVEPPPSFDSLNTSQSDSTVKEMIIREDNMKFPLSMKLERPKPETNRELGSVQTSETPSPVQLKSSLASAITVPNVKEIQYLNTDGSSDEDPQCDHIPQRPKSPSKGDIIRTSDLLALSRALTNRPSGSPNSFHSQTSFGADDARRSSAHKPKEQQEFNSSTPRSMPMPIPHATPKSSNGRLGTSPNPGSVRLAPDSFGNEIPADAKWTKIARRLVSPEVLDQDHRRYEARPDFVAVLGVLSRDEIEDYAVRTEVLRSSRPRRSHAPPAPSPNLQSTQRMPSRPSGRDTPSTDEDDESSDERLKRPHQSRASRSYTPSGINSTTPRSGYPNPFGFRPPPSPVSSPSLVAKPVFTQAPSRDRGSERGSWTPQSGQSTHHSPKDREQEREPSRRHHHSSSKASHSSQAKPSQRKDASRSRWKENLTAASIGGAAASLLNVLAEAAEGL